MYLGRCHPEMGQVENFRKLAASLGLDGTGDPWETARNSIDTKYGLVEENAGENQIFKETLFVDNNESVKGNSETK